MRKRKQRAQDKEEEGEEKKKRRHEEEKKQAKEVSMKKERRMQNCLVTADAQRVRDACNGNDLFVAARVTLCLAFVLFFLFLLSFSSRTSSPSLNVAIECTSQ